jgi:hypothetical protein
VEDAASAINQLVQGGRDLCFQVERISSFQNTLHFISISQLSDHSSLSFPQSFFSDFPKKTREYGSRAFSYVCHGGDFDKGQFHSC